MTAFVACLENHRRGRSGFRKKKSLYQGMEMEEITVMSGGGAGGGGSPG